MRDRFFGVFIPCESRLNGRELMRRGVYETLRDVLTSVRALGAADRAEAQIYGAAERTSFPRFGTEGEFLELHRYTEDELGQLAETELLTATD